jgi:NAD(P) transhydrogenase
MPSIALAFALLAALLSSPYTDAFVLPSLRLPVNVHSKNQISNNALFTLRTSSATSRLTMQTQNYDLVVIGGGPVGITAALAATATGRTVALIDGTPKPLVPFTGPTGIFSKALRDSALKVDVNTLRTMGMHDTVVWKQVQEMTDGTLTGNGLKNMGVLESKHIPFIRGQASFVNSNVLNVNREDEDPVQVQGKNILVATGSSAYRIPGIPYDDEAIFDSDTIKKLNFLPKSVTIIGAGLIAIEYARIFSRLQCRVTMLVRQHSFEVALKRIGIDNDVAIQLQKDLNLNKIRIIFNAQLDKVEQPKSESSDVRRSLILRLTTADGKPHPTNTEIRSEVRLLLNFVSALHF